VTTPESLDVLHDEWSADLSRPVGSIPPPPTRPPASYSWNVEESVQRLRLGETLVDAGAITTAQLNAALAQQSSSEGPRRRLGHLLFDQQLVDSLTLAQALSTVHDLPLIDLDVTDFDKAAARLVPRSLAERHGVLALSWDGPRLRVAVADPLDIVALDDVRTLAGASGLEVFVTPEDQLRRHLSRLWSEMVDNQVVDAFLQEVEPQERSADEGDEESDATAIRMVDRLVAHGARLGASDIHFEPQQDGVRIRMRVDGILREVMQLPLGAYSSMIARLKLISGLNVIERRVPQDGRTRVRVDGTPVDIRVSTLPSLRGEKVVLRLLPHSTNLPSLDALGLDPDQSEALRRATRASQGLILITGPTGSGKTNTLYASINDVVGDDRNVVTLEDPVEVELPGTTQVQIDDKLGMTFVRGLRAVLRQDPDVVLVGEIRDRETAELAIRAALTGHLVLSTLHTLDASSALTRLLDMGVPSYLVSSSLSLVIAQRLLRTPCSDCVATERVTPEIAAQLGIVHSPEHSAPRPVGCPRCGNTGYRGRTGIFETLAINAQVRTALLNGGGEAEMRHAARTSGSLSLLQRGALAALSGRTTVAEVLRVLGTEES